MTQARTQPSQDHETEVFNRLHTDEVALKAIRTPAATPLRPGEADLTTAEVPFYTTRGDTFCLAAGAAARDAHTPIDGLIIMHPSKDQVAKANKTKIPTSADSEGRSWAVVGQMEDEKGKYGPALRKWASTKGGAANAGSQLEACILCPP